MAEAGATEDTAKDGCVNVKIIKEFSARTTLHGINSIADSKTRTGQLIWTVLLLLAFGYTVKSTVLSFIQYSKYPFSTEISEEFAGDSGLRFPAITVCPMNMFVKRKIELHDYNPLFNKYGLNLDICKESKSARQKYNMTCGQLLMCTVDVPQVHPGNDCWRARALMLSFSRSKGNFSLNFEEEFRHAYGPSLEHSIRGCRFGQEGCTSKDFKEYVTNYGNCYQYNGDVNNATHSFVKESLTLILDAKIEEYTKSPFYTEGFKLYIHDQGTFNAPEGGFVVSPGNIAMVTVKQKQVRENKKMKLVLFISLFLAYA
jgi:hypothetical protein